MVAGRRRARFPARVRAANEDPRPAHRPPVRPRHVCHLGLHQPPGGRARVAAPGPGLRLLALSGARECDEQRVPDARGDRPRSRPAEGQDQGDPHLRRRGHHRAGPGTRRGARPERHARHLARPPPRAQRTRDPEGHRTCPCAQEHRPRDRRQRVDAARRHVSRRLREVPRPGPRRGRPAGQHGRALARLDEEPVPCRPCRFHHRASPAVLGGRSRREGGRLLDPHAEDRRAPVSGQAGHHRRGGLAVERPDTRQRGRLGIERGAVPAPLPRLGRAGEVRLLHHGGLRSALETADRERCRRLLGRL